MTLSNRQREFRGLLFGGLGTDYILQAEDGLTGRTSRVSDLALPTDDGSIPGVDLVESRTIVWTVALAGDPDTVEQRLIQLSAALGNSRTAEHKLTFKDPGQPEKFVWARVSRWTAPRSVETEGFGESVREVSIEFHCPDPRIYHAQEQTAVIQPFAVLDFSGIDLPFDLDADFPGGGGGGANLTQLNNIGATTAWPVIQFQVQAGTVTGLELTNLSTGQQLVITETLTATPLAIATGQTLVADMLAAKTKKGTLPAVRIQSSSRVAHWQLPREPFGLAPGFQTLRLVVLGEDDPEVIGRITWNPTEL